jgi:hypothetical protein
MTKCDIFFLFLRMDFIFWGIFYCNKIRGLRFSELIDKKNEEIVTVIRLSL